jgi:hypothetical protein
MIETEMIERVARVFYEAEWNTALVPFEGETKEFAMTVARAAIEAMREPTPRMMTAFHDVCDPYGQCDWKKGWQAMIDAVLKENP